MVAAEVFPLQGPHSELFLGGKEGVMNDRRLAPCCGATDLFVALLQQYMQQPPTPSLFMFAFLVGTQNCTSASINV